MTTYKVFWVRTCPGNLGKFISEYLTGPEVPSLESYMCQKVYF